VEVENGTYWAAARYLEAERVDPYRTQTSVVTEFYPPMQQIPPRQNKSKRKSITSTTPHEPDPSATSLKRHKKSQRQDAMNRMQQIVDTPCDATEDRIYETGPYIIEQVRSTL
jgi:hypothetical protein